MGLSYNESSLHPFCVYVFKQSSILVKQIVILLLLAPAVIYITLHPEKNDYMGWRSRNVKKTLNKGFGLQIRWINGGGVT